MSAASILEGPRVTAKCRASPVPELAHPRQPCSWGCGVLRCGVQCWVHGWSSVTGLWYQHGLLSSRPPSLEPVVGLDEQARAGAWCQDPLPPHSLASERLLFSIPLTLSPPPPPLAAAGLAEEGGQPGGSAGSRAGSSSARLSGPDPPETPSTPTLLEAHGGPAAGGGRSLPPAAAPSRALPASAPDRVRAAPPWWWPWWPASWSSRRPRSTCTTS